MSEVKWIKIKTGLFDGTSFKRIKKAKIGGESFRDKLTAVWFELLDLGAKCNNDGWLYSDEIPYGSEEDIAIMIDRDVDEVKLCLQFYVQNGMIEIIDNLYCLSNWTKYQNVTELEKIREQGRIRQAKYKQKQKLLASNVTGNVTVTLGNAPKNKNIDIRNNNILPHTCVREEEENSFPTLDEVISFCKENNFNVNPKHFFNHYNSLGWKINGQPIKDWKVLLRTWYANNTTSTSSTRKANEPEWLPNYEEHFEETVEDL